MPLSFAGALRSVCQRVPDKVAIEDDRRGLSYRELRERSGRAAALLRRELGAAGAPPAAIVAGNSIEYCEVVLGAAQAGHPLATVNPRLADAEVRDVLADCGATVILCDEANRERLGDLAAGSDAAVIAFGDDYEGRLRDTLPLSGTPEPAETSTFTIPYTSGTTGGPKGVLVSHRSRILTIFAMAAEYGCFGPEDRFLALAPLCHGAGLVFTLGPLYFGGHVRLLGRFDPEATLAELGAVEATGVFMVPTHFAAIFDLPQAALERAKPAALRAIISNAAPLSQPLKERIVGCFGEGLLHETYGSTEGGIVTNLRPADQLRKIRCVGLPIAATEVSIRRGAPPEERNGDDGGGRGGRGASSDQRAEASTRPDGGRVSVEADECAPGEVGELYSMSPYLFSGYWNRPDETRAAFDRGWVSVGDMARRDEEGYVYIVDRKKDMVVSGGVNVYPREVEQVLEQHPALAEVAVVGVPDRKWGETLKAYVVMREGEQPVNAEEIGRFCEGRLGRFKLPRRLEVVDEIPKNATGKVLKAALRARESEVQSDE